MTVVAEYAAERPLVDSKSRGFLRSQGAVSYGFAKRHHGDGADHRMHGFQGTVVVCKLKSTKGFPRGGTTAGGTLVNQ